MTNKKSRFFLYVITVFFCLIALAPVLWVVLCSFKSVSELFSFPPSFLPKTLTLENYATALRQADLVTAFKNSMIITVCATLLTVCINTMAGYALAKFNFRGSTFIFLMFISTSIVPMEVVMIPVFQVVKTVGFYNNYLGMIIPPAASSMGVFILRQHFQTIPDELMEAARIDGASEMHIFVRLMLPLAKPAMSALLIFSFMWRWNDYLWPLLVIMKPDLNTMQLLLKNCVGANTINWAALLAMTVISMVPVLVIFLIFQKQFVQGMATSGLKE